MLIIIGSRLHRICKLCIKNIDSLEAVFVSVPVIGKILSAGRKNRALSLAKFNFLEPIGYIIETMWKTFLITAWQDHMVL
jgi:hypothetical protein